MKVLNAIAAALSKEGVAVAVADDELTVVNRTNGNELKVYREAYYSQDMTECFIQYIVCFSTQHRHFDDDAEDCAAEILAYIRQILSDEVLPFEFYRDGKSGTGGEITREEAERLTVSGLAKQYGYTSDDLLPLDYTITSWSGKYDSGIKHVADLNQ